jgi:hypothetical protein
MLQARVDMMVEFGALAGDGERFYQINAASYGS